MIKLLIGLTLVALKGVNSQTLPNNPCPNLFQYFQNNGIVYGRMEFPNDFSGYYRLTVNMSVAAYIVDNNRNIQLQLRTSANDLVRGRPVIYYVYFPIQEVIPKPTRIEFNQRIYCAGPPEEVRPGRGVTNMWATTYYRITAPFRTAGPNSVDIEVIQVPEINFSTPSNSFVPQFTTESSQVPPFIIPLVPIDNPFLPSAGSTTSTTSVPIIVPTVATSPTTREPPRPQTPPRTPPTIRTTPSTTEATTSQKPVVIGTTPNTNTVDLNPVGNECGLSSVNTQQLIVNGDEIVDGQFPWLVAIMYKNNFDYKYRCTGSLVSNRHVVTAGHCIQFNTGDTKLTLFSADDLLLAFGKHNIESWENAALLREVKKVSVHPDYKQSKGDCDVAVLSLEKPIQFEPKVRPVCLWEGETDLQNLEGIQGTVVGWGTDKKGKDYVDEARKVNMPIVSQSSCLRSDTGYWGIVSNRTFCAGNRDGSGPCFGDSGAGFIINRSGKWTLRGVVSTALGDVGSCDLNNYIVFADVAKVAKWIKESMD